MSGFGCKKKGFCLFCTTHNCLYPYLLKQRQLNAEFITAMIETIRKFLRKGSFLTFEQEATEAYDIWSFSYDNQPGNLMLDLDEIFFDELIRNIDLQNKVIADVGCGTGRYWQKIYDCNPAIVLGFDVSAGMLNQLVQKFPTASVELTTDNLLSSVADSSVDCLITTL